MFSAIRSLKKMSPVVQAVRTMAGAGRRETKEYAVSIGKELKKAFKMIGVSCPKIPGDPKDFDTGLGVTGRIPDEVDQATGIERRELLELLSGNDDPFGMEMEPKVGPVGTLEEPRMIPSHLDARVVGICDDSEQIHYFELQAGEPQFVNGEYYQLYKVDDDAITH
eukprot:gene2273-3251_t